MSQSIELKLLPLTLDAFLYEYESCFTENHILEDEYLKYLQQNKEHHHYNGISLEDWYKEQTQGM